MSAFNIPLHPSSPDSVWSGCECETRLHSSVQLSAPRGCNRGHRSAKKCFLMLGKTVCFPIYVLLRLNPTVNPSIFRAVLDWKIILFLFAWSRGALSNLNCYLVQYHSMTDLTYLKLKNLSEMNTVSKYVRVLIQFAFQSVIFVTPKKHEL